MKKDNLMKSLSNLQEALEVANSTMLDNPMSNDDNLKIWKSLNTAIKSIEDAKVVIFKNEKNQ